MTSRMNTEYIFNTTYRFAKWKKNKIKSNKQTKFVSTLEGSIKEKDTVQNHWKKYLENFLNFTLNTHTHTYAHPRSRQQNNFAKREIKGEKDVNKQKVVLDVPTQNTGTKGCTFTHRLYRKKLCPKNIHQVKLLCLSQSSRTTFSGVNLFSKYDIPTLTENSTYEYSACRV